MVHVFLCGVSTDDLIGDGVHRAAKLVQLIELLADFKLLPHTLLGCGRKLLFQLCILRGQLLIGLIVLFQLRPHDLHTGDILVQQRLQFFGFDLFVEWIAVVQNRHDLILHSVQMHGFLEELRYPRSR